MLLLLLALASSVTPMNHWSYHIANPIDPGQSTVTFSDRYFEVRGPLIKTRYSEVFWQMQKSPLPAEIVSQFDGAVLAITGIETDIMRLANGTEESVPCYQEYNHHWSFYLRGKGATFAGERASSQGSHGRHVDWNIHASTSGPHIQAFSEGNGNEHRRSFKGYPAGFAQLIESPVELWSAPMIINTKNADLSSGTFSTLLPANSLAPPGAGYSGIMECPCTTRIVKVLDAYKALHVPCSASTVTSSLVECEAAAKALGLPATSAQVDASAPVGCSATYTGPMWQLSFNGNNASQNSCGEDVLTSAGSLVMKATSVTLALTIDPVSERVTVELSGPADGWFAVGFNASLMSDLPYTIIVDGTGAVSERALADHAPGQQLATTVTVKSHAVKDGIRTVVVSRPLKGKSNLYYTFSPSLTSLDVISARGSTPKLSYHSNRTGGTLQLTDNKQAVCLCRDPASNKGTIAGVPFNPKVCAPAPTGDLLTLNNSICSILKYNGGLKCCSGGTVLLDHDQDLPAPVDAYYLKYRFYYQEAQHKENLFRLWWGTEAYGVEYDVPKCAEGTPPAECVYTITSTFTGADLFNQCMAAGSACGNVSNAANGFKLLYAAGHCHAPACMSLELHNMDTGELICRNEPVYGHSLAAHDEENYVVAIPPCVWGPGFRDPPLLHANTSLRSIKRTNNTNGHWGVMGLWQMRGAYA